MSIIAENLTRTLTRITEAESRFHRPSGSVTLMAVSKTRSVDEIREAYENGARHFGENYLQDAEPKIAALNDIAACWHFIGPLQSNKTRTVAEHFDWLHSLDRLKIARRLNDQRPTELAPLNVCLQVNISNEANKSGVAPEALPELAKAVAELPRLALRGLMAIPAADTSEAEQREAFAALRACFEELKNTLPDLDTLSMGMSDDMDAAIAEGSTMVRIGTAIFGPRAYARPMTE